MDPVILLAAAGLLVLLALVFLISTIASARRASRTIRMTPAQEAYYSPPSTRTPEAPDLGLPEETPPSDIGLSAPERASTATAGPLVVQPPSVELEVATPDVLLAEAARDAVTDVPEWVAPIEAVPAPSPGPSAFEAAQAAATPAVPIPIAELPGPVLTVDTPAAPIPTAPSVRPIPIAELPGPEPVPPAPTELWAPLPAVTPDAPLPLEPPLPAVPIAPEPASPPPEPAYSMIAPIELTFDDDGPRLGVRPGTPTSLKYQRIAQVLFADLKRATVRD